MEALPTDALTVAVHATAAAAWTALRATLLSLQTLKAIADDCNGASFEAAIQQQLTNAQTAIIANDNANTTYIIRTAIEADLAAAENSTPVALFMTPETQCLGAAPFNQCGLLGMTRVIVVQTIARLAGAATAQANAFLAKGDQYRSAGDYRSAYHQYRLAYKAAVK